MPEAAILKRTTPCQSCHKKCVLCTRALIPPTYHPNDMSCLSLVETLRSLAALEMPCDDCREFGNPQRRPEVNPSNTPFSRLKSFRAGNSEPRGSSACALVAGRGVEVDTLAMNVALSTGVVADHIEDSDAGAFKLQKHLLSATEKEVEALLAEARNACHSAPRVWMVSEVVCNCSCLPSRFSKCSWNFSLNDGSSGSAVRGRLQVWTLCRRELNRTSLAMAWHS